MNDSFFKFNFWSKTSRKTFLRHQKYTVDSLTFINNSLFTRQLKKRWLWFHNVSSSIWLLEHKVHRFDLHPTQAFWSAFLFEFTDL